MKKKVTFIFTIFASIFILSACNQAREMVCNEGECYQAKELNCKMIIDQSKKKICKAEVNNIIEDFLYEDITSVYDKKRCNKLNTELQKRCIDYIGSTGIQSPITIKEKSVLEAAIAKGNIEMCSEFQTEKIQEYCLKHAADTKNTKQLYQIAEEDDIEKCDELSTDGLKQTCIYEIEGYPEEPETVEGEVEVE